VAVPSLAFSKHLLGDKPARKCRKTLSLPQGGEIGALHRRFRKSQTSEIGEGGGAGVISPLCGGESNFDGLVERSEGQTSEIAREGIANAAHGMSHSDKAPTVALRKASPQDDGGGGNDAIARHARG
jgi:hypothetical protein